MNRVTAQVNPAKWSGWRPRILFVVVLILASVNPVLGIARQNFTEYQSELLGWTIEVSGPNYVIADAVLEEYPHGWGERVFIGSRMNLGNAEIAFFDDEDTPEQTIDLILRDFDAVSRSLETLQSGADGQTLYVLARFMTDAGIYGYVYVEVTEDVEGNVDVAQVFYSLDLEFLDQFDIVREEISIEGRPFLTDPRVELKTTVTEDLAMLASTPEPVPTPDQGRYTFPSTDVELEVGGEIEFDFPLINRNLDVMFLSSQHGYGVVGFIHQDAETAHDVVAGVFVGAPAGAEAPTELYSESDDSRAFAVYRVVTQGETRAMVIEVTNVDNGLWEVQAIAVTEAKIAEELTEYQNGVIFRGEPLLGDVNPNDIELILESND